MPSTGKDVEEPGISYAADGHYLAINRMNQRHAATRVNLNMLVLSTRRKGKRGNAVRVQLRAVLKMQTNPCGQKADCLRTELGRGPGVGSFDSDQIIK